MGDVWAVAGSAARRQFVLDVVGAAFFGLVLVVLLAVAGQWAGVIAVVLLTVALALRHRLVALMVVLAVAAALVQVVTTQVVYPADAAYAVLFFSLGAHPGRGWRAVGLSCAVAAGVVAGTFQGWQASQSSGVRSGIIGGFLFAAVTLLFTVGGWAAGYIRWLNRRSVQARVDAQLDAAERRRLRDAVDQEQERARIATDMHDVVAHSWAVVAAQADGARYTIAESPEGAERALELIGETARSAIADLRMILARLRYQEVRGATPGYEQQRQLFGRMRASGMRMVVEESGAPSNSPMIAMTAYRLLSESLTNALKHGDLGEPVSVRQDWCEGYRLRVTNAVAAGPEGEGGDGHGIMGMRERAAAVGGSLASRRAGDRWVLEAHLPEPASHQGGQG